MRKAAHINSSVFDSLKLKGCFCRFWVLLFPIVFSCSLLEASFDKFDNWGFEQGGGLKHGNFTNTDREIVVFDSAWDATRKQLAVAGKVGRNWAVRVYRIDQDGPVQLSSWDGNGSLHFAAATSVAWNESSGLLISGVEHVLGNKTMVRVLGLNPEEPQSIRFTDFVNWETVDAIEQDPQQAGQMIVAGTLKEQAKCALLDASEILHSKEFGLEEINDLKSIAVVDDLIWIGGHGEDGGVIALYHKNGELLDDQNLGRDVFISRIVEANDRVFVTGRTRADMGIDKENFFLLCLEWNGEELTEAWSVICVDSSGGREWGTVLQPLADGGILVGGSFKGSWLLGQSDPFADFAMLSTSADGVGEFDSFIARYNEDGELVWAQSSDYRGNDFLLDMITDKEMGALIIGNRKNDGITGPFLERLRVEGSSAQNAVRVFLDEDENTGLNAFNWEIPEILRFGEPIGNEFFSARGFGKAKFEYDLNGERITKESRPMFEPGEISMQARLLRDGVERNATTHTLTGLKGRPYLKIVFEQNQTELKLIPELFGLHPDHLSDPSKALELNDKIILETSQKRGLENLDKGRLRIDSTFSGILHASAFFPGDVHYEEATARISLQVKQGKVTKLGREGMVTIQVKDLDGWQENHLVNEGQELIIAATQGFGKNRKFKQWVEFSEDVQKLRTARVQSPFNLRTALIADEDMTLFARYNYTFVGTAINGYISGAKVFLDLNLNGNHDEGEPSGSSMKNGGFEIEMEEEDMQMHDKNQNGKLDPSEAMIVIMGGLDQSSKLPLKISYKSPPGYKVITSISTLIAEFLKGEFTESEAEKMVSQYISLPNDINFSEFEPLRDVFSEGEKARNFVLRSTQLSNLLNEGSRFLKLKSGNQVGRVKASQFIIKALRDRIIEESLDPNNTSSRRSSHSSDSLDLNDPSVLLSVINSADEDLANSDESDSVDELSESTLRGDLTSTQPEIAEAGNDEILNEIVLQIASANVSLEELANDPNVSPEEFKSLASASQSILDELGELTSNTIFEEELEDLSYLTGEDAVSAASIIDQSVEVQSLPDSSGPPTLDSNSLRFFSLDVLKETSSQNQTNVYAPVLTDTTIFAPDDFSDNLILGSFLAYDPEGADITYSIVGQNPDHDLDGTPMLSIDSSSGEIKVLDFDDLKLMTEDTVSLIVRLSDPDGLFRDDEITLNLASWTYFAGRLQIPELSLSVPENMPVGTTIHTFEKEDAQGGLIEYQLVRGTGDTNNESFSIDSDGNLKTAKVFDYESGNTEQMIRLQAIDSQFNFVEESLTIQVSDLLLPNIQTGDATIVDSKLHFDATVTSFGDFTDDLEFGFYMSRDSITNFNDSTVLRVSSSFNTDTTFTAQTTANLDGGSYRFIAFAQSAEGIKLGAEKTFMLPRITASEDWTDGQRVAGYEHWWASDWFGLYNTMYYPWIYHQNLGWIYIHAENENGSWMYHKNLGWNWTIPDVFPHLYVSKAKVWSYVSTESPQTKLYDYQLREWFRADAPIEITGEIFLINGGEVTGYGNYYRWDRVVLEAKPKSGFNFAGWSGGLNSMDSLVEFQAVKNIHIDASFLSIRANDLPSQEMVKNIQEVLGRMSHLSKAEKDKSLAELLINGTSPTSGLSIKKN